MEDYIVIELAGFNDVRYEEQADQLYELSSQPVEHFLSYLSTEETRRVIQVHQRQIGQFIHAQMLNYVWSESNA
ncbi:hypothetical protein GCM10028806_29830 [Spirosoma terrae]